MNHNRHFISCQWTHLSLVRNPFRITDWFTWEMCIFQYILRNIVTFNETKKYMNVAYLWNTFSAQLLSSKNIKWCCLIVYNFFRFTNSNPGQKKMLFAICFNLAICFNAVSKFICWFSWEKLGLNGFVLVVWTLQNVGCPVIYFFFTTVSSGVVPIFDPLINYYLSPWNRYLIA